MEPEREEGQTATGAPTDAVKKTGVNPEIVNDNGSQFMAKDFKELVKDFQPEQVRIQTYHPESTGKLRWRLGNLFMAVGGRKGTLGVVDVCEAARVATSRALHGVAPETLNMVDPGFPTKARLVKRLRQTNPGLCVAWLPRGVLWPLSWIPMGLHKVLCTSAPAINVPRVLARWTSDTGAVGRLCPGIQAAQGPAEPPSAEDSVGASVAGVD